MKRLQVLVGLAALLSMGGCLKVEVSGTHGPTASAGSDDDISVSNGVVEASDGNGPTIDIKGPTATEQRHVQPFHAISVGSVIELKYQNGDGPSVKVEAQKDLLPHLMTTVEDGTLHIYLKGRLQNVKRVMVTIRNPHLDYLQVSGAAKADCTGINERQLGLSMSGSSETTLHASAEQLNLDASGASQLHAGGFRGTTLKGQLSGSSQTEFDASFGDTELELSGAAELKLGSVNARRVNLDLSGSATVEGGGKTDDLKVTVTGAGDAKLGSLQAMSCHASADGGSSVEVNVVRSLHAEATGAGHVSYQGNPTVEKSESGAGSVSAK